MAELIPIVGGSLTGLLCARYTSGRARWVVLGIVSLALAFVAGTVSGELEESWAFLLWDLAQALAAGALVMLVYVRMRAPGRRGADG